MDDQLKRLARSVSLACALATVIVGGLLLLSWTTTGGAMLGSVSRGIVLKTNTALGLFLTGLALLALRPEPAPLLLKLVGRALALVVMALGIATLSEHLVGWDLGIDEWLMTEPLGSLATTSPNRMGPPAALAFPLLGAALLLLEVRTTRGHAPAQALAIGVLLIALVPVLGYVFETRQLYGIAQYTGIALPTALLFLVLGIGVLFARPGSGAAARLLADDSSGMLLRRLIPTAILLPIVLGRLRVAGERAGLYDIEFGLALLVFSFIVLFSAVTWWTSAVVQRHVGARARAEDAEREMHQRLLETLENERQARALAEKSNRVKDEFLATLSHELRTPLAAIFGWVQLLSRGAVPERETRRALEAVERNARLQLQLIEDLLDMSRIEAGTIRLELRDVDLVTIIDGAIATTAPVVAQKGLTLERQIAHASVPASGDAARLQQVLGNLINNAVKFTPTGGRIVVALGLTSAGPEVTVRDTGVGIRPDFLAHVFDRFRQADPSTTRTYGGLGLGLSIARQLTELHGGTLVAESDGEGCGSTFRMRLPASPAGLLAPVPPAPVAPPADAALPAVSWPSLAGTRVLVVDDQEDACVLFDHLLTERGAEVTTARSVDEAIERLAAGRFDVLVSDIAMPIRDGFDLLRHVREHVDSLPAIALTAFASTDDRERALSAGFQAHLTKPVSAEQLIRTVAALGRPHSIQ
jgi:signal transduction histidine kinase/BarA-like signal transduction histidine kinase